MLDILEEHFEEIQFLWEQREKALRSPDFKFRAFLDLEERMEAHVQGLLTGGMHAIPLLEAGLATDDPAAAFTAAYVLLRSHAEVLARKVIEAFMQAKEEAVSGFRQALSHGPIAPIAAQLYQSLAAAPPLHAAAIAEVLAFHGCLPSPATRLEELKIEKDPAVRLSAWRAIRFGTAPPASGYQKGVTDDDSNVRKEVLEAAAWTRQSWLLDHCRGAAAEPAPEHINEFRMLAILGTPVDLAAILAIGNSAALGPHRFGILAAFGHPDVMDALLAGIGSDNKHDAVAAATAFTRITGFDVAGPQRITLPPADGSEPDEFQREFLDEVLAPNVEQARSRWKGAKARFAEGVRWRRGQILGSEIPMCLFSELDMESRWETCLRAGFNGDSQCKPAEMEAFPQTRRQHVALQ